MIAANYSDARSKYSKALETGLTLPWAARPNGVGKSTTRKF